MRIMALDVGSRTIGIACSDALLMTAQGVIDLPVTFWDERLSTVMAERQLIAADVSRKKRKGVIDKMAAVVILQGYLDRLQFSKS